MTATFLKTIAVLAMIIDHLAGGFVETTSILGQVMHGIGRLTFPIMAYFIAEGFNKTSNIKAYIKRMGIFALISHIPFRFYIFGGGKGLIGPSTSVLFTFFISLLILYVLEHTDFDKLMKGVTITILLALSSFGDYGIFGPLLVLAFHKGFGDQTKQLKNGLIVILGLIAFNLLVSNFESIYAIATIVPILLLSKYNGERGQSGRGVKYSFYIIYPLQFVIIGLLEKLVH